MKGGRYLDSVNTPMPTGFGTGIAYPLAACPTYDAICGNRFVDLDALPNKATTTEITFEGSKFKEASTCNYIIRSKCKAPFVKIGPKNTLISSTTQLSILEWNEDAIETENVKQEDFYDYKDFKFPAADAYLGDATFFTGVPGVLGDIAAKDKDGRKTPGQWIQYQMAEKRKQFVKYNKDKILYD